MDNRGEPVSQVTRFTLPGAERAGPLVAWLVTDEWLLPARHPIQFTWMRTTRSPRTSVR